MSDTEGKDEPGTDGAAPDASGPGASEEDRRTFLKVAGIGGIGAGLALVAGGPAVAYVAYPLTHTTVSGSDDFLPVGKASRFPTGKPVKVDLFADKRDAWNRIVQEKVGSAWVINRDGKLRAYTTVCPHLGCAVDFDGEAKEFKCPCHRSTFSMDGKVEGGPAPRGMDELDVKEDGDLVGIRFQRFRQGIEEKEVV
jgi:Rieske Fe-S protein